MDGKEIHPEYSFIKQLFYGHLFAHGLNVLHYLS